MVDPKELTDAERLKALMDQINEGGSRRIALLEQEKAFLGETRAFTESQQELLNINLNLEQSRLQVLQQQTAKSVEKLYNINSEINTLRETERINKKLTENEEDRLWTLKRQSAEQQKLVSLAMEKLRTDRLAQQAGANLASAQQNFYKTTLGVSDAWKTTLAGAIVQSGFNVQKMWQNTKGMLTASNMLGSTWMKIVEMTIKATSEYDSMAAKIRQISHGGTGLNSLQQQTMRAHISMREFGVSIQDAGQSTESLLRSMASFSVSSAQTREALIRQTNLLQEVGVGAQGSAQAFNFMDKGLNMTTQQSIRLSNRLFGLSKALKQPPDVIFKDWEQASNELAKYGDRMYEVFAGLSAQAKNTGLAVSQLIGIAAQFDTFDQAGQAVGRLNAILGGPYLNAIEMVYATESERIAAMRESISVSGRVFTQLSRHEQQAIAAAAGIRDMSQAAMLFGGSSQTFERAAASQEALEKKARGSQSALNKLKMAAYGLAVNLAPVVEKMVGFLDILTRIASHPVGRFLGTLIISVAVLTKGINAAVSAGKAMKNALGALKNVTGMYNNTLRFLSRSQNLAAIATRNGLAAEQAAGVTRSRLIGPTGLLARANLRLGQSWGMALAPLGALLVGYYAMKAIAPMLSNSMRMIAQSVSIAAIAWAGLNMAKQGFNPAALAVGALALGAFVGSLQSAKNKARAYEEGTPVEGAEAGLAIVGEAKKREGVVVNLAEGQQVLNNENTEKVLAAGHRRPPRPEVEGEMETMPAAQPGGMTATVQAAIAEALAPVVSALQAIASTSATAAATGPVTTGAAAGAPVGTAVNLYLDRGVLGSAMVEYLNSDSELAAR